MGITETALFYLVIGVAIGFAVALSGKRTSFANQLFRIATATLFWPFYLPLLLTPASAGGHLESHLIHLPDDETAAKIMQAEHELNSALSSLDGWVGGTRARHGNTINELRCAWTSQSKRIREIDEFLSQNDVGAATNSDNELVSRSERARRANISQLREVRERAYGDLVASLDRVRELASMIHLAKFTGAPTSRADELIAQLAATVKSLSSVAESPGH
jgi:hypothetical protein